MTPVDPTTDDRGIGMGQGQEGAPIMAAPAPALRRDNRAAGSAAALPAAGAVARVHTAGSVWTSRGARIVVALAIVFAAACLATILLATGTGETSAQPWSASTHRRDGGGVPGMGGSDRDPAALADLDDRDREPESTDSDETEKSGADRPDSDRSQDPGADSRADPGTTNPGAADHGTNPGTADQRTNPGANPGANPGTANPSTNPGAANPGSTPTSPTGPSTQTNPTAPVPPPPPAPKPLAFGTLSDNHVVGLLGIKLFSGYTLTLTGQPGATASVTYGSKDAGTVRFDGSGRAAIEFSGSVLEVGLSNPLIRVAYSDGTAGSAIEARRDSI